MSAQPPPQPATVAYVFLDFAEGGAQRLALAWWRTMDRARFRPVLLLLRGAGRLRPHAAAAAVPVHAMGRMRRSWDAGAVPLMADRLSRLDAKIVHVALYSRAMPYALAAARLARVPVIVAHEHSRPGRIPPARRLADRLLADGVRYLACSRADAEALVLEGHDPSAVIVLPNGVEEAFFNAHTRRATRRRLGLAPDARAILVPARLAPRKGHIDFLASLPAIISRATGVTALLAGDGPLRRPLEALVASSGLADVVRFLGHRDDMPDLIAAADIVVLPSRLEGHPLVALEAMAGGRPVVATRVGGIAEAVTDGVTGRLVQPQEPQALADAVLQLLNDTELAAGMGEAGRRRARLRFTASGMTRRLEDLYEGWLESAAMKA